MTVKETINLLRKDNKESFLDVGNTFATELISSFIKTINPKKALLLSPAYSEYENELNKINCEIVKYFSKEENNFIIDTKELVSAINSGNYGLSIICNPNNPTGFAFSRDEIEYILKNML